MEEKILEMCSVGMSAYRKAEGTMELGVASDIMADCLREIMLLISDNCPELVDKAKKHLQEQPEH